MYEKRGDLQLWYAYSPNGNLAYISTRQGSGTVYEYSVICNTRGDILDIYYLHGELAAHYIYDTWGNTLSITDAAGSSVAEGSVGTLNPIRYRGYYADFETELVYVTPL